MALILPPALLGDLWRSDLKTIDGFAFDPENPDQRLVVSLVIDGVALALARAETLVQNEPRLFGTDRCYGFRFFLPDPVLESAREVWVELANHPVRIGKKLLLGSVALEGERQIGLVGQVAWYGGLRLHGTIERPSRPDLLPLVRLYEAGQLISTIDAFRLDVDPQGGTGHGADHLVFDALLPLRLADGLPHEIRVLDALDRELAGSPVLILGLDQGVLGTLRALEAPGRTAMAAAISNQFDRLMPGSLNFTDLVAWQARTQPAAPQAQEDEPDIPVLSFADGPVIVPPHIGEEDIIILLDRGAVLEPGCQRCITHAFQDYPYAILGYGDLLLEMEDGALEPLFRPAFDRERLTFQDYTFGALALRAKHLAALIKSRGAADGLTSTRQVLEALVGLAPPATLAKLIMHLPAFLARSPYTAWAECLAPRAPSFEALTTILKPAEPIAWPRVEVIIPTRDRLDLLKPCLETLLDVTAYPDFSVLILDNGSEEEETLTYLAGLTDHRIRVMRDDGPFNYARLNNKAVEQSAAPLILLLNNDIEILEKDWLSAMVLHLLSAPDTGAIGAMLLWPNRQVQHGGVILGTNFGAVHAHNDRQAGEAGYGGELLTPREASAVTAACLLCRRETYLEAGGLDAVRFPVAFNDVDLCLTFRAMGRRNIWTPLARLLHRESASRGRDHYRRDEARLFKELNALRRKWGQTLMADPYYHPALNLDPTPYTGLALNPRPLVPRFNLPPQPDRPIDPWGRPPGQAEGMGAAG